MSLQLGDTAPDFSAPTTEGQLKFYEWAGDAWVVLFSHPRDFTPVCTTELGYVARLQPEFAKRNVKAIGLSVDSADSHQRWSEDIRETQGQALNFPVIADLDRSIARLYGMIHPQHDELYTDRFAATHRQSFGVDPGELASR
jgi:alkyl hydroperoxide reductase subunit AhpC